MIAYLPPALFISAAAFTTWSLATTIRNAWPAIVELVAEVNASKANKQWREW